MAAPAVLVMTGASRGIGAATAQLAAERGYTVLINYPHDAEAASSVAELDRMGRFAKLFAINITGAFVCAGAAIPRMSTHHRGDGGVIVNVSSAAAKLGGAHTYVGHAASKGHRQLHRRPRTGAWRRRHQVNAGRPGLIDSEIRARMGDPDRLSRLGAQVPMRRAGGRDIAP